MPRSFVSSLECARCKKTYDSDKPWHLCECGSPLLVKYELEGIAASTSKQAIGRRPNSLWRYREFLPVKNDENIVTLGEGMTPIVPLSKIGEAIDIESLYVKDEGLLPSGSFKTRGAAVGISRARELGVEVLAMPTNGNAGGAWAIYAARAGIRCYIIMPKAAPFIPRNECAVAGACLFLVDGLISDAGRIVSRAIEKHGWYDASTLKEPYRIEGKKTMGFEIAEQFGWNVPDVIVYPTGGGVGIIGIYKALRELQHIAWLGAKMPRLVAVQSSGCAPIVKAWEEKATESLFWEHSNTVAFGINVPKALGDFLVLEALYASKGCAVAVDDEEIVAALKQMTMKEGVYVCPEGAATLAAVKRLREKNWIKPDERVLLLNTGSGLKYPETVAVDVPVLSRNDLLPV
jgi:threonine synthase